MQVLPSGWQDASSGAIILIAVVVMISFFQKLIPAIKGGQRKPCYLDCDAGRKAFNDMAGQLGRLDESHHGPAARMEGGQYTWQLDARRAAVDHIEAMACHKEQMAALAKLDATMGRIVTLMEAKGGA